MQRSHGIRALDWLLLAALGQLSHLSLTSGWARTPLFREVPRDPFRLLETLGALALLPAALAGVLALAIAGGGATAGRGVSRVWIPAVAAVFLGAMLLPAAFERAPSGLPATALGYLAVGVAGAAVLGSVRTALSWLVVLGALTAGATLADDVPWSGLPALTALPAVALLVVRAVRERSWLVPSRALGVRAAGVVAFAALCLLLRRHAGPVRSAWDRVGEVAAYAGMAAALVACVALWVRGRALPEGVQVARVQPGAALELRHVGEGLVASLPIAWAASTGWSGTVPVGAPLRAPVPLGASRVVLVPGASLCVGAPVLTRGAHRGAGEAVPWVFPGSARSYLYVTSRATRLALGLLLAALALSLAGVAHLPCH